MISPSNSQQLFLHYALDELSPDERSGIDEALIADQGFSDAFEEARYDLIDAYAADELPIELRKRVEQAILSTIDGHKALAAAIGLRQTPSATSDGIIFPPASTYKKAAIKGRGVRIVFLSSALAACVLVAVLSTHLRQKTNPAVARKSNTPPSATSASIQPATPAAKSPPAMHSFSRQASILTVAMPLGPTRGAATIPIKLRPGIRSIEVEWPVPPDSAAISYTMKVAPGNASLDIVHQHGPLAIIGNVRVANFFIPANKLPNGAYIFRLLPANAAADMLVAEFPVHVSR